MPRASRTIDKIRKFFWSNVTCQMSNVGKSKGFTLVEVLLFLLVVLVLTTILLTAAASLVKTRGVHLDSIASQIASCEIEELRKIAFVSLPTTGNIGPPCDADLAKLPPPATAERTVVDFQTDPDIKQITIAVNWTESGITQEIKMETLISKYGL